MRPLSKTEWIIQIILCNLLLVIVGICAAYYAQCRANIVSRDLAQAAALEVRASLPDAVLTAPDTFLDYGVFLQKTESHEKPDPETFQNAAGRDQIWAADRAEQRSSAQSAPQGIGSASLDTDPDSPDIGLGSDAAAPIQVLRLYYGQQDLRIESHLSAFTDYLNRQIPFYAMQPSFQPAGLTSIAGQPVFWPDQTLYGYVYVAKNIPHVPATMLIYALLATLLYYAVVFSLVSQKQSRERVEQIYHQYIANISHELKTPIASIQAITEILNEGNIRDEASLSRYYGMISRESRLLEHSVLQIIELSKLQDGQLSFNKVPVTPHELLDPIEERFGSRCEEAGIHFSIEKKVYSLPTLLTDPYRLTQLLEILLDNAFKFVADDGHIFIDATSKYGQATLRVNDDGRGISDNDFPHIFERFYKTTVDNPTGSGLGLAIAREIVDGLGERIWVQSKEGEGTIFFVTVSTE